MIRSLATAATLLLLAGGASPAQEAGLGPDERLLHILSRFTPGVTPALVEQVRQEGLAAWIDAQLKGDRAEPEALTARLRRYETLTLDAAGIADAYLERPPKDASPAEKAKARRRAAIPGREMLDWIVLRAVYGANPLRETSADFFRNHFCVSMDKQLVNYLVVDWERSIILGRALGNFGEMLEATAKHPCMLQYLDNALSRRPAGPAELAFIEARARRQAAARKDDEDDEESKIRQALDLARQRGLNENYARELMELHTLGVDNYYSQADVQEVAKCLTGWTLRGRGGEGASFSFAPLMHCGGDKRVLGQAIRENRAQPIAEGEQVLSILREHEGTARFLSWKLCRWFVNDEPEPAMVDRIAAAFRSSKGDLKAVYRAILQDPAFFDRKNYRAKYKRPSEFILSALRVTGADIARAESVLKALTSMNEPLYRCGAPTGYYDQAESWADPGSMAARWTFADDLVRGKLGGISVPASFYAGLDPAKPASWKETLAAKILPISGIGRTTSARIDALVQEELRKNAKAGPAQVGPLIASLLLGSSEFQRQ